MTKSVTTTTLQPFNGLFSRTTRVSRYQKGKTNLDFTGARDSEWQWHQLGHMQVCTSLQTDNHASTPSLCFLQAGCPSCRPTNSVKALKSVTHFKIVQYIQNFFWSKIQIYLTKPKCYLHKDGPACVKLLSTLSWQHNCCNLQKEAQQKVT